MPTITLEGSRNILDILVNSGLVPSRVKLEDWLNKVVLQ